VEIGQKVASETHEGEQNVPAEHGHEIDASAFQHPLEDQATRMGVRTIDGIDFFEYGVGCRLVIVRNFLKVFVTQFFH
jgi:hypothetical protein